MWVVIYRVADDDDGYLVFVVEEAADTKMDPSQLISI